MGRYAPNENLNPSIIAEDTVETTQPGQVTRSQHGSDSIQSLINSLFSQVEKEAKVSVEIRENALQVIADSLESVIRMIQDIKDPDQRKEIARLYHDYCKILSLDIFSKEFDHDVYNSSGSGENSPVNVNGVLPKTSRHNTMPNPERRPPPETSQSSEVSGKSDIDETIDGIIRELRENPHSLQPTTYEEMLSVFKNSPDGVVKAVDLEHIFPEVYDPKKTVQDRISRLNARIEKYNLRVVHLPAYEIKYIKNNE